MKENISKLLDSLETFDWTRIPKKAKFKKDVKRGFNVELIKFVSHDNETYDLCVDKLKKRYNDYAEPKTQNLILDETVFSDKLQHVNLVKDGSDDIYILTVKFTNLLINQNNNMRL